LIEIYFSGVLSSGDDFETSDEIFEAVGDILREVAEDKTDEDIRSLCDKFHSILMEESQANSKNRKILDAPIQLNQISTNMEFDVENMTSIWIQGRNDTLVSSD
jgi:ATP-binding cassette, subfamily F, member 3